MALQLSPRFKESIQGSNTALTPVVTIGSPYSAATEIYLSTTKITLDESDAPSITTLPLLLSMPSIKESIDLETKKYKISSLSLTCSNYEYDGKRLSERLDNVGIANKDCYIYFVSPNAKDMLDFDDSPLEVFKGIVRDYKVSDEKVSLMMEDRSQIAYHKDLPLDDNYTGTDDSIPDRHKNKPIPMVYGKVKNSPCALDSGRIIKIDSHQISNLETDNAPNFDPVQPWSELKLRSGDKYLGVWTSLVQNLGSIEDNTDDYTGIVQWSQSASTSPTIEIGSNILTGNNILQCIEYHSPQNVELLNATGTTVLSGNNFTADDIGLMSDNDLGTSTETAFAVDVLHQSTIDGQTMADLRIYTAPKAADILNSKPLLIALNQAWLPFAGFVDGNIHAYPSMSSSFIEPIQQLFNETSGILISNLPWFNSLIFGYPKSELVDDYGYNGPSYYDILISSHTLWRYISGDETIDEEIGLYSQTPQILIQDRCGIESDAHPNEGYYLLSFRNFTPVTPPNQEPTTFKYSELKIGFLDYPAKFKEITIKSLVDIKSAFNKDFFVSVDSGRVKAENATFDTIINHLVSNELNMTATSSLNEHSNIKYGFTINEKINSKKLIEQFASASMFIPRINSHGEFKLNVIKKTYTGATSADGNEVIKKEDVIDFSYSRTPVDKVYTKVILHYDWDYGEKSYKKRYETEVKEFLIDDVPGFYEYSYYGLNSNHSESTLVIDDHRGKFLNPNDDSYAAFAENLLLYHANQHLKIKVKLPLKYLNLEVGDTISFKEILGDVKPYGIDYVSSGQSVNGQNIFPYFIITSTNKGLNSVQIECEMTHSLDYWKDCAGEQLGDAIRKEFVKDEYGDGIGCPGSEQMYCANEENTQAWFGSNIGWIDIVDWVLSTGNICADPPNCNEGDVYPTNEWCNCPTMIYDCDNNCSVLPNGEPNPDYYLNNEEWLQNCPCCSDNNGKDNCGVCNGNCCGEFWNLDNNGLDCHGDCCGSAYYTDGCDICVGGNTGYTAEVCAEAEALANGADQCFFGPAPYNYCNFICDTEPWRCGRNVDEDDEFEGNLGLPWWLQWHQTDNMPSGFKLPQPYFGVFHECGGCPTIHLEPTQADLAEYGIENITAWVQWLGGSGQYDSAFFNDYVNGTLSTSIREWYPDLVFEYQDGQTYPEGVIGWANPNDWWSMMCMAKHGYNAAINNEHSNLPTGGRFLCDEFKPKILDTSPESSNCVSCDNEPWEIMEGSKYTVSWGFSENDNYYNAENSEESILYPSYNINQPFAPNILRNIPDDSILVDGIIQKAGRLRLQIYLKKPQDADMPDNIVVQSRVISQRVFGKETIMLEGETESTYQEFDNSNDIDEAGLLPNYSHNSGQIYTHPYNTSLKWKDSIEEWYGEWTWGYNKYYGHFKTDSFSPITTIIDGVEVLVIPFPSETQTVVPGTDSALNGFMVYAAGETASESGDWAEVMPFIFPEGVGGKDSESQFIYDWSVWNADCLEGDTYQVIEDLEAGSENFNYIDMPCLPIKQAYFPFSIGQQVQPAACPDGRIGDVNMDGAYNVLDVVTLATCVMEHSCGDLVGVACADMNGDGEFNVLDVVTLVNCVLASNCENYSIVDN